MMLTLYEKRKIVKEFISGESLRDIASAIAKKSKTLIALYGYEIEFVLRDYMNGKFTLKGRAE